MVTYEGYIIGIEDEYMALESLKSHLQGNEAAYIYLLESGYIKSNSRQDVSFSFVGVISLYDTVLCILPKYYEGHTLSSKQTIIDFTTIIKVLKRVHLSYEIPDQRHLEVYEHTRFNEILAADKFLKDYLEYGIYEKSEQAYTLNSEGEVNWEMSINQLSPVFSKRQPIYSDVYTRTTISEDYNVITELHKWIIRRYLNKYGEILGYNFSFAEDTVKDLSTLGSNEYLKTVVRKELNHTFTDREILLLKRVLSLLNSQNKNIDTQFNLFGTGYFHVVWEAVCGEVLQNKYMKFKSLIPEPVWNDMGGNKTSKDTLRPDIISTVEAEQSKFFIFDAKYYNLCYAYSDEFKVNGNPGIQDVSKQFLYSLAFKDVSYDRKYNCFLFPKLGNSFFEIAGFVSFDLFKETKVCNIFVSPNTLFKRYLSNNFISADELNSMSAFIDIA